MSKKRMLDTKFWVDNYIMDLDTMEKALFLYLLTNEHTNISGIYEIHTKVIANETGIDKESVLKMIAKFSLAKKIAYIEGWIVLVNFVRHQTISSSIKKGIEREILLVPVDIRAKISENTEIFEKLKSNYEHCGYTLGGRWGVGGDTLGGNLTKPNLTEPNQTDGFGESLEKKEPVEKKEIDSIPFSSLKAETPLSTEIPPIEGFEDFWKLYPKKLNIVQAKIEWRKSVTSEEIKNKIMKTLPSLVKSEDWKKDEGKWIPFPAKWLENQRWKDEVAEVSTGKWS